MAIVLKPKYWQYVVGSTSDQKQFGQANEVAEENLRQFLNSERTDHGTQNIAFYQGECKEEEFFLGLRYMESFQHQPNLDLGPTLNFNRLPVYTFSHGSTSSGGEKLGRSFEETTFWQEAVLSLKLSKATGGAPVVECLMTKSEHVALPHFNGQGGEVEQLLLGLFDRVEKNYACIIEQNRSMLWNLSQKCVEGGRVRSAAQLAHMEELHQMNARYIGLKRRLGGAIEAASYTANHPFFRKNSQSLLHTKLKEDGEITSRLKLHLKAVEEHTAEASVLTNTTTSVTNMREINAVVQTAKIVGAVVVSTLTLATIALIFGKKTMNFGSK